ncbi:MAG: nucleotidyltransferase domain-containing protein [Acidobacteriota bacterium]|jgi:predicted nucleotidyltransferase|nr:nucleotidyltransferase domain-containing protein [Acidobacteriota bacterium]
MVNRQAISHFAQQIVEKFQPNSVILFGSYAYGQPNGDSDVDLLVIMPYAGHPAEQAIKIRKAVRAGFPLDLIVKSPAEIRRRLDIQDPFIGEIMGKGVLLHEGLHNRVD